MQEKVSYISDKVRGDSTRYKQRHKNIEVVSSKFLGQDRFKNRDKYRERERE